MVTVSNKHFGELVAKSLALDVYKNIANFQCETIRKQEEASKLGMERIKELEGELTSVRGDRDAWHNVYNASTADLKSTREKLMRAEREIENWKEMYAISRRTIDKFDGRLKAVKAALE